MFLSLSLSFNKFSQTITALYVFTTPRRGRGRRRGNDRRVDHDWRERERDGRFRDDAVDVRRDLGERECDGNFVRERSRREP